MNPEALSKEELTRRQGIITSLGLEIGTSNTLFGYSTVTNVLIDFSAIDPNYYAVHMIRKIWEAGYTYGCNHAKEVLKEAISKI